MSFHIKSNYYRVYSDERSENPQVKKSHNVVSKDSFIDVSIVVSR